MIDTGKFVTVIVAVLGSRSRQLALILQNNRLALSNNARFFGFTDEPFPISEESKENHL